MYLVYANSFENIRNLYFNKIIDTYFVKNKKLLDYGCGPGDMLILAKKKGVNVFGIDISPRSQKLAKDRGLNIELGDYRALKRRHKPNSFDYIFLQSVIEHIQDPIKELQELTKFLKKDGLLIISAPTPGAYFWNDPTHVRPYTPKGFATLAEICELKVVEINYVWSFLLGFELRWSIFFQLMNIVPFSMGSNIIGVFKK